MTTTQGLKPTTRDRTEISENYTWDLSHIYPDWQPGRPISSGCGP